MSRPFRPAGRRPIARCRGTDPDRGQVLPLAVIVLLVALGAAVVIGQLGGRARDRALARTAADAAALASVVDGQNAAERAATENGAELISWDQQGRRVEVRVRVGTAEAVAWATTDQIRVRPRPQFGPLVPYTPIRGLSGGAAFALRRARTRPGEPSKHQW